MTTRRHHVLGYGLAALVVALDQLVKWWVTGPLELELVRQITILPTFNLTYLRNYGISLGLFQADSAAARWLLVALTAAIAAGVAVWIWRERVRGEVWALALVLGGAIGNIIDRARLGYVVDYADLHFGGWQPFYVFNLADAAISVGVAILLLRAFLMRGDTRTETTNA